METYTDSPYRTFAEETAGGLTGKEGYFVELTANGKVQLVTTGLAIGVMHQKLQGSNDVTVRMLGKGGTVKVVQNEAVTVATRVKSTNGGKAAPADAASRSLGIKISPTGAGAANDLCEIVDVIQTV